MILPNRSIFGGVSVTSITVDATLTDVGPASSTKSMLPSKYRITFFCCGRWAQIRWICTRRHDWPTECFYKRQCHPMIWHPNADFSTTCSYYLRQVPRCTHHYSERLRGKTLPSTSVRRQVHRIQVWLCLHRWLLEQKEAYFAGRPLTSYTRWTASGFIASAARP